MSSETEERATITAVLSEQAEETHGFRFWMTSERGHVCYAIGRESAALLCHAFADQLGLDLVDRLSKRSIFPAD